MSSQTDVISARCLDEPVVGGHGEGAHLAELLADVPAQDAYERVDQRELAATVPDLLDDLSERERTVIRSRYGLGRPVQTLREVAPQLGVSAERVRQIERDAPGTPPPSAGGHAAPMLSPAPQQGYPEPLREVLLAINRRRRELQRQLRELAGRRMVMAPGERITARETAVELRDELARLDLVAAVATRLLQPAHATRSRPGDVHLRGPEPVLAANGDVL